jgi:hypothetical protein
LADRARNPWFARAIVNRVWYWLLGRGIVEEPDDIRDDNPPENARLLEYLERELVASHYDLKHIFRLILNSSVYQLSAIPANRSRGRGGSLRGLSAAADWTRKCSATRSTRSPERAKRIRARFPNRTPSCRISSAPSACRMAASAALSWRLFGRPARDSGLESERNNRTTDAQRLHLLNSTHVQRKIQQGPKLVALYARHEEPARTGIATLSDDSLALPDRRRVEDVAAHLQSPAAKGTSPNVDLAWGLINSAEFLYRH